MNHLNDIALWIPKLKELRKTLMGTPDFDRVNNVINSIQENTTWSTYVIETYSHKLQLAYQSGTLDNTILPGLKSVHRYYYDVIELLSNGALYKGVTFGSTMDSVIQFEQNVANNKSTIDTILSILDTIVSIDCDHNVMFGKALSLIRDPKMLSYYEGLAKHNRAIPIESGLVFLEGLDPKDINLIPKLRNAIFTRTTYPSKSIALRKELNDAIRSAKG